MNDKLSNLEAELASLTPRELSTGCVGRIDAALADSARKSWYIGPRRLFVVAALAAACLLIAAAIYWSMLPKHGKPDVNAPLIAGESPSGQPCASLADYRQAIARGPAEVDALLDRDAAVALRTRHEENLVRAGLFFPTRELIP